MANSCSPAVKRRRVEVTDWNEGVDGEKSPGIRVESSGDEGVAEVEGFSNLATFSISQEAAKVSPTSEPYEDENDIELPSIKQSVATTTTTTSSLVKETLSEKDTCETAPISSDVTSEGKLDVEESSIGRHRSGQGTNVVQASPPLDSQLEESNEAPLRTTTTESMVGCEGSSGKSLSSPIKSQKDIKDTTSAIARISLPQTDRGREDGGTGKPSTDSLINCARAGSNSPVHISKLSNLDKNLQIVAAADALRSHVRLIEGRRGKATFSLSRWYLKAQGRSMSSASHDKPRGLIMLTMKDALNSIQQSVADAWAKNAQILKQIIQELAELVPEWITLLQTVTGQNGKVKASVHKDGKTKHITGDKRTAGDKQDELTTLVVQTAVDYETVRRKLGGQPRRAQTLLGDKETSTGTGESVPNVRRECAENEDHVAESDCNKVEGMGEQFEGEVKQQSFEPFVKPSTNDARRPLANGKKRSSALTSLKPKRGCAIRPGASLLLSESKSTFERPETSNSAANLKPEASSPFPPLRHKKRRRVQSLRINHHLILTDADYSGGERIVPHLHDSPRGLRQLFLQMKRGQRI